MATVACASCESARGSRRAVIFVFFIAENRLELFREMEKIEALNSIISKVYEPGVRD